jgi:hypothetical protein
MERKKSFLEKLGLIKVEETAEEVPKEPIFSPKNDYIKDKKPSEDASVLTDINEDLFLNMNMHDQGDEFEIQAEKELFEKTYIEQESSIDKNTQELFNSLDLASMKEEEDRVQLELYEEKEDKIGKISKFEEKTEKTEGIQTPTERGTEPEFLTIDQIYEKFHLNYKKRKTIFIIKEFINALPDSLPTDIKRKSIMSMIMASGIDIKNLIDDASKRLEVLNTILESQLNKTEEIIEKDNKIISELENQIAEIKKKMTKLKKRQEEQKNTIEYENQRIVNILQFIDPEKYNYD